MFRRRKKNPDLLEMSASERNKFTRELQQRIKKKAVESKLKQMLLEASNLTVNGKVVLDENQPLQGITVHRKEAKCHFYYIR